MECVNGGSIAHDMLIFVGLWCLQFLQSPQSSNIQEGKELLFCHKWLKFNNMICVFLSQWLLSGGDFVPRGHLAVSGDISGNGRCYWYLVGRYQGPDCLSEQGIIQIQKSIAPMLRNTALGKWQSAQVRRAKNKSRGKPQCSDLQSQPHSPAWRSTLLWEHWLSQLSSVCHPVHCSSYLLLKKGPWMKDNYLYRPQGLSL